MSKQQQRLWGSTLLVTGTTVGAGMLALPVATAQAGFWPAIMVFVAVWLMMVLSAFCFVELSLSMPVGTHLVSMAKHTLGRLGQLSAWWVYLALLYALNAAYLSSLSHMMAGLIADHWHFSMPLGVTALGLVVSFVCLLCAGVQRLDGVNRWLMLGLFVVFVGLLLKVLPHGQAVLLQTHHIVVHKLGLPIVVTAFGFHIIVPSLRRYCGDQSAAVLPKAVVIGSLLPLVMYILWEWGIMSVVPHTQLMAMLAHGQPAVMLPKVLASLLGHDGFEIWCQWLSFFAVTTSFLGVSLSLLDFLFDGLQWQRSYGRMACVLALTFLPPMGFTLYCPQGFVLALTYAGYFVSYLLIFLPAWMLWRHRQGVTHAPIFQVIGGRWTLVSLMVFAVWIMALSAG